MGRAKLSDSAARCTIRQPVGWWPYQVEKLRQLWAEGKTASAIAAELGPRFTRNSVIGKAHRLGLPARPSPIGQPVKPWPAP